MKSDGALSIEDLKQVDSIETLRMLLQKQPEINPTALAEQLHAEILAGVIVDSQRSARLVHIVRWLADVSHDNYIAALAARSEGHLHYAKSNYVAALASYENAIRLLETESREEDVARTLTGAMQSLIYLGMEDRALEFAERARAVFERVEDSLRLARLDSNVANIYYRQDRYAEARALYTAALERMLAMGRFQDAAAVLGNIAVASTGLGEFPRAASEYARARALAESAGMNALLAELDYNIAYLHFLKGDHTTALLQYREARRRSEEVGDKYHAALCDFDRAEVYLELNLINEGIDLADRAAAQFENLNMAYERAKALAFSGIGEHSRGNTRSALLRFNASRPLFIEGRNPVWAATVDLCRSLTLHTLGQDLAAWRFARRAARTFELEHLPHRRALVELHKARIVLHNGNPGRAARYVHSAFRGLDTASFPTLKFQMEELTGEIKRAQGHTRDAFAWFLQASKTLESVRCQLAGNDIRVAFVRNRENVYAQLITLVPHVIEPDLRAAAIFGFIESAKSRSLADRVGHLTDVPPGRVSTQFLETRQQLHNLHRAIDSRQAAGQKASGLKKRAAELERTLEALMRDQSLDEETRGAGVAAAPDLETIASSLPDSTQLVEYFIAGDKLWAGTISSKEVTFHELGDMAPVSSLLNLWTFQISKRTHHAEDALAKRAIHSHLQSLHRMLVAPLAGRLHASHLVFVPHGQLHQLPFHALFDGSSFLIDRYTVSYAPSAGVFHFGQRGRRTAPDCSLVMGVPDEKSPAIAEEVALVGRLLPEATILLNEAATTTALLEHSRESRFIHIAAHGVFRQDNPMFSSLRLGDGSTTVLDLYRLRLQADLVTLSGCQTGAGTVHGGDEVVGFARGLLQAGARAVLLALWEADDATAVRLMKSFYGGLKSGKNTATALRGSMLDLKAERPEPYFWAPFALSGYPYGTL